MKKVAVFAGLFVLMIGAALASMIRFTGPRPPEAEPATLPAQVVATGALVLPVVGVPRAAITDTWGQSRAGGARAHQGTDIMAPRGTPVVAVAPGSIEKLFLSQAGGITLYTRSPDRRWSYYYAHLSGYAAGVAEGMRVEAGQVIGYVGDTGNAGTGNHHLHFGVARTAPQDRWYQGQPVNPYPLLARARSPR